MLHGGLHQNQGGDCSLEAWPVIESVPFKCMYHSVQTASKKRILSQCLM